MSGNCGLTILIVLACFLLILVFLLLPFWILPHPEPRKATCQANLKEISLALIMYMRENNDALPSSAIAGVPERAFRSTLGDLSFDNTKSRTVFEALYPMMRPKEMFFCPSDASAYKTKGILTWKQDVLRPVYPEMRTSYTLKKAINDAWLNPKIKAQKETDYKWPSKQLMFYERCSFHWDNRDAHVLGVNANCAFMDGHVKRHQITRFEPDYYNWNMKTNQAVKQPQINPRLYADRMK